MGDTPTTRDSAIAQAIAALEKLPGSIVSRVCDLEGYTSPDDQPDLLQCTTGELEACAENSIYPVLASLRALASAPAGQSDAGRDGVMETKAKLLAVEILSECSMRYVNASSQGEIDAQVKRATDGIAASFRALASAPSETTAQVCEHDWRIWPETDGQEQKCMKCGAYRRTPGEAVGRGERD